jgi:hypothetical protein
MLAVSKTAFVLFIDSSLAELAVSSEEYNCDVCGNPVAEMFAVILVTVSGRSTN